MLLSSTAHAEGTGVWATYGYNLRQGSGSEGLTPSSRSQPTHATLAWWDGPHSAISTGNATFGAVDVAALVSSTEAGLVNHFIYSGFADQITLSRPDLAGQAGQITLRFQYGGRLTVFAGEGAQVSVSPGLTAYVNAAQGMIIEDMYDGEAFGHRRWAYVNDVHGINQWDAAFDDRYLTMTADFVWGEPVLFGITASTSGYSTGHSGHSVAYGASWGGIVEATAGGRVISDYSLRSLTGTDYARPIVSAVPEPRSIVLLAAGLGLLMWRPARRDLCNWQPLPGSSMALAWRSGRASA